MLQDLQLNESAGVEMQLLGLGCLVSGCVEVQQQNMPTMQTEHDVVERGTKQKSPPLETVKRHSWCTIRSIVPAGCLVGKSLLLKSAS